MGETGKKGRMIDTCVTIQRLLDEHKSVKIRKIMEETGISYRTARRYLDAFSGCYDLRIERGDVIVGE